MTLRKDSAASSMGNLAKVSIIAGAVWAGITCDSTCDTTSAGVTGEQIARGNVTFERNGDSTIIRASDGSIINCFSFDILPWETVQFIQPNQMARVLNRITGPDPTVVQGKLLANGQVYVVNPAGVYFTGSSVVDVAGLYAAAGHISDKDFISGTDRFTDLTGEVINYGTIRGGNIHLIGEHVANHGTIVSDGGIVTMLAGDSAYLRQHGERIVVKLDGADMNNGNGPYAGGTQADMTALPGVENTGSIVGGKGQVILGAGDLYSLAIRNSGRIEAAGGEITLAAKDGLIHNTGLISASIADGQAGTVTVQAPSILNSGVISADSDEGQAGYVEVTSQNHTFLRDSSVISASGGNGTANGGEVLVHSYGGLTVFADGSIVDVSAGERGGNGGLAEVSGHALTYNGSVRMAGAEGYEHGTLIIDPYNLIINEHGGNDSFLDGSVVEFGEGGPFADGFIAASSFSDLAGDVILRANGTIYFNSDINFENNNNLTCEALKSVTVRAAINGANNVYLYADVDDNSYGWVSLNVPLLIGGNAEFSGTHVYFGAEAADGYTVQTGGTQQYWGTALMAKDQILRGTEITFYDGVESTVLPYFHDQYDTNCSLTTYGKTTFNGPVGETFSLRSLDINGPAHLNGGLIRTKEHQSYFGPVTLGGDAHLLSLNGGDIRFADSIDAEGRPDSTNLLVATSGTTWFDGPVGSSAAPTSVTTDAGGKTVISDDMISDILDFDDAVILGNSVKLTGTISIDFASTISGENYSLRLDSPDTKFHGDVTGVDWLITDEEGTTYIATGLISADKIDFLDEVRLREHSTVIGKQWVDFHQRVYGAHDLHVMSDYLARFGGNVGGPNNSDVLMSLRVDVAAPDLIDQNLIIFDGENVWVWDDILLNEGGRSEPAQVATIAARGPSLTMKTYMGDIYMGLNEKMTSLGDLDLISDEGSITVGDLNANGDMGVHSGDIRIWGRVAGLRYDHHGVLVPDKGAEIIATDSIFFSSTPTVVRGGGSPIFATRNGRGISANLGRFENRPFKELTTDHFTWGDIVLDLGFPIEDGPNDRDPTTPDEILSVANLAVAFDDELPKIKDRVRLDPFALRAMERMAIYMRSLNDGELVETVTGREMYNDASGLPGLSTTVTNRLRRSSVLRAMDQHSAIFVRSYEDPTSGNLIAEDQSDHIRSTLAASWQAYATSAGDAANAAGFRSYLESDADHAEALVYCDSLRELFREIHTMGATRRELRASLNGVLAPITPEAISQADLEQAIGVRSLG